MSPARATIVLAALCAVVLSCPSGEAPREQRRAMLPDTAPRPPATSDSAPTASDSGPRGVLALGTSWIALEERDGALAIVEHCFGNVPTLTLALDSAPPRVERFYGQDAEVFEVGTRQEDDTLLRLEIGARHYPSPGTLQLVVRDPRRGVMEVTQEIAGQRLPSALFVSTGYAAGFRRVPRPADCGLP